MEILISCYELGHQPLGLALPLGFLERAGYSPEVIDLAVEGLDVGKVARARFVGISVPMHTALRIGVKAAFRVREINPDCHISFFGLYSSLNAQYLLGEVADSVIGGEYEAALLALVESLSSGDDHPIEGVSRRGRMSPPVLAHLPFVVPSRRVLPGLERYAMLEEKGSRRPVGYVEASRGCRHLCRHCPIPSVYEGRFFLVPQEVVLEDIRNLVRSGATHITFGDPDFLNGPNHSLRIIRAMRREFPNLTFDFTAKIEHILKHRDLFPEFAALGCLFVVSAVESLSDEVLGHLAKHHTREDVIEALSIVRSAGIALRPSLVAFTPWTTLEDYIELFEFVEREGLIDHLDPIQFAIRLLVPPGSLLLSEASMRPYLGPLVQETFTYRWEHPDPRMDALYREVSGEVERATGRGEDPLVIFYRLKALAIAVREGGPPEEFPISVQPDRSRPPRLTEPWFCCAEPTANQVNLLRQSTI